LVISLLLTKASTLTNKAVSGQQIGYWIIYETSNFWM
jgi:hypothetical protein